MMQTREQPPRIDVKEQLRKAGRWILRTVLHNGPYKLLALVLAVILWAGLITQDASLTREKHFEDVKVTISGEDTLKRKGFIITSDMQSALEGVEMTVNVPQLQYNSVQAGNYTPRIDLSRINRAGTQNISISTTSTNTYGAVEEIEPSEITIVVEDYITRSRIPVLVSTTGKEPEGYYVKMPAADPMMVSVSGPESLVEQIACANVTVDLSTLPAKEGPVVWAAPFKMTSVAGEEIAGDLLEITNEAVQLDSVIMTAEVYPVREIALSDMNVVRGKPAAGYEVKSISVVPGTVTVAGEADKLEGIDILYPDSQLDVTGVKESIQGRILIRRPEELVYLSTTTATVAVEVGPVITSKTFDHIRVYVQSVENEHTAELMTRYSDVSISGEQLWMDGLKAENISLYVDLTGLTEGTYYVPVLCKIADSEGQNFTVELVPDTVEVLIHRK